MIEKIKVKFEEMFGVVPIFPENIVTLKNNVFAVSEELKNFKLIKHPLSVGVQLNDARSPTWELLNLNKNRIKNYLILNDKSSFLFTCNRKVLKKSITKKSGQGPYFVVMNKRKELLGIVKFNREYSNVKNIGYYLDQDHLSSTIF